MLSSNARFRRLLWQRVAVAGWLTAVTLLVGCDVDPRACESQEDCFGGELCRDGVCVEGTIVEIPDGGDADARRPPDANTVDCRLRPDGCGQLVCNVTTGACEACQRDRQCPEAAVCDRSSGQCRCELGFHACGSDCLPDDSPDSCGERCEPCDAVEGGVATCEARTCGVRCEAGRTLVEGRCVGCASDDDCSSPGASSCVDGECVPCVGPSACDQFPDAKVCVSGVGCVECTIGEELACGGKSCDPATYECTSTDRRSREFCQSCVADSECEPDHRCVPMKYAGAMRESAYCLPEADGPCLDVSTVTVQRDSLSGVRDEYYCTIREDLTTCEAVEDFRDPCTQDSNCGHPDFTDGLCRTVDGARRCTYRCVENPECANGTMCIGNPPDASYCYR